MATINVFLRPDAMSASDGHEKVMIEVELNETIIDIPLGFRLQKGTLSGVNGKLKFSRVTDQAREKFQQIEGVILKEVSVIKKVALKLETVGEDITAEEIYNAYLNCKEESRLICFMGRIERNLKIRGHFRTAETYRSALNSFKRFLSEREACMNGGMEEDIPFYHVTPSLIREYEGWMFQRGLTRNSISFYMRILRAVFNRAVEEGLAEDCQPFKRVYTGVDKTIKRALPLRVLKKIRELNLADDKKLDYARDMFMMSFYLRGMSLVDMAFLKKKDLAGNFLVYRRRKTQQLLKIRWTKEMQVILDKYGKNESEYLLPIIKKRDVNGLYVYRHVGRKINSSLKILAERIGLLVNLTMYVARHSWASVAKSKGIPVSVISEGMGHDSETTTRIYLAELDTAVIDRANRLILNALDS